MKLYVGKVSEDTTNAELRQHFEKYGEIDEAEVLKGYAFVHFNNDQDGRAAISNLNGSMLCGNRISVLESNSKGPRKPTWKIFIGNLPTDTNSSELKQLFLDESLKVAEADTVKNYGFVHIDQRSCSKNRVNEVIRKLDAIQFKGNTIKVELSVSAGNPRDERDRGGRGGGRDGGYRGGRDDGYGGYGGGYGGGGYGGDRGYGGGGGYGRDSRGGGGRNRDRSRSPIGRTAPSGPFGRVGGGAPYGSPYGGRPGPYGAPPGPMGPMGGPMMPPAMANPMAAMMGGAAGRGLAAPDLNNAMNLIMAAAQLAQAGGPNAMTMLQTAAAQGGAGGAAAAPANPSGDFAPRTAKSDGAQATQGGMPRPAYSGGSYEDPVAPASSGRTAGNSAHPPSYSTTMSSGLPNPRPSGQY